MPRPCTTEETLILRAFQRQVDRLRSSSIVQAGGVTFKISTTIKFPTGETKRAFEGYGPEVFQSQLPILRQFLLQDKINFNHIHNILNQCCDRADLVAWTRFARQRWDETLETVSKHPYFASQQSTVEEAMDRLFYGYGGLFHVDINHPKEEEEVRDVQSAIIQQAFPFFWNCLKNVDSVIHIWLDEPSKLVPPVPAS